MNETPIEIIARLEAGRPGSKRLANIRSRIEGLSGVDATLLSLLCAQEWGEVSRMFQAVAPMPAPATEPRGIEALIDLVEGDHRRGNASSSPTRRRTARRRPDPSRSSPPP